MVLQPRHNIRERASGRAGERGRGDVLEKIVSEREGGTRERIGERPQGKKWDG